MQQETANKTQDNMNKPKI